MSETVTIVKCKCGEVQQTFSPGKNVSPKIKCIACRRIIDKRKQLVERVQ